MNTLKKGNGLIIGFFTDTYFPQINGVSENVKTSAEALRKRGHTVYIFAPKVKGYKDTDTFVIRFDSIRYLKNPEQRFGHPNSISHFVKLTNKKFDIIHCHAGLSLNLLGLQIAIMKGVPIVLTYHTLFTEYAHYFLKGKVVTPGIIKRISKLLCNISDVVIAPSSKIETVLHSYSVRKPILIVPGGIDIEKFSTSKSGFLYKKLGIPKNSKIVLYSGRIGKEKNIQFLLEAFKKIVDLEGNAAFVLVGDGPEKKHLERKVMELGIGKSIFFTGFIEPELMPKVYKDAYVFLFSSLTETQGLVVAEAQAAGVPVIALKDDAISEMVIEGETGFLTDSEVDDFSKKALLLLTDEKKRNEFSKNAKKRMAQKFSQDLQAAALEEIYQKLVLHYNLHPKLVKRLRKTLIPKVGVLKGMVKKLPGAKLILTKIPRIY